MRFLATFPALLLGCASGTATGQNPAPLTTATFAMEVDGIPVVDSLGQPFDHPWLGGLNLPRPQLIDIDQDDDLDLFVQEYSDRLMFFEQTGTLAEPRFTFRTNAYQDLSIGEWYRFADMDGDGDVDLLAERPFSHITYYRNDGTGTRARFVLAADTLRDASGAPIFADRQNIPQVTDINCNDRLDLFIGRITGTLMRYEEVGRDDAGVPRFRLVTERFEDIEIVNQIGSNLHGANTMSFVDIEGDGDKDLFWGDFFEPGLLMIENTGTCSDPSLRGEPIAFPRNAPIATSGYNASAFGDTDRDGDLDLMVGVLGGAFNPNRTTIDNFHFLEAAGAGELTTRTTRVLTGLDEGSESIPVFADLDGDADLDLLVSNKIDQDKTDRGHVAWFENTGSATAPSFTERGTLEPLSFAYHLAPAFADLDGDGDLDMIAGQWRATLSWFRNEGDRTTPRFVLQDSAFVELTRGSNAAPSLVDIDADGDADLFVGEASGTINFYRNDGTPASPAFTLVSDEYLDIDIGRRSFPTFADVDQDGDQDLIVGSETGTISLFRNIGSPTRPDFVPDSLALPEAPPFATPRLVDIDGDGDLDMFYGGVGGGVFFHRNTTRN